jgi:hypothetical protein
MVAPNIFCARMPVVPGAIIYQVWRGCFKRLAEILIREIAAENRQIVLCGPD